MNNGTQISGGFMDPCPQCRIGCVCRTIECGRLNLPLNHPFRTGNVWTTWTTTPEKSIDHLLNEDIKARLDDAAKAKRAAPLYRSAGSDGLANMLESLVTTIENLQHELRKTGSASPWAGGR